jgi:hypothetical protein
VQCPHCAITIHEDWTEGSLSYKKNIIGWKYRTAQCPGCYRLIIELCATDSPTAPGSGYGPYQWVTVYPSGANRGPIPPEVPPHVQQDYVEACSVLPFSAKASAALSRRCLQTILHEHGYKARDLAKEIDLLLTEADPQKGIPAFE